jgi:diguanylate cyclase (GGDEF)-like protein
MVREPHRHSDGPCGRIGVGRDQHVATWAVPYQVLAVKYWAETNDNLLVDSDDSAPVRAARVRSWLAAPRPATRPVLSTGVLSAALLLAALVLLGPALSGTSGGSEGLILTWWQLAPLFALAAGFVFHIEVNSEAHTFSVSEVPFVLALFFASPRDLIIARLLGEAVTLILYERQAAAKLALNLSLFTAESCLALTLFHAVIGSWSSSDPFAWIAALIAVGAAAVLGVAIVWTVIRWHGGQADAGQLVLVAGITAICNTSLAAVAAVLVSREPAALLPLALVATIVVIAYRGYSRLTKRYAGLEMLYEFTRLTSQAMRPEETIESVLDEARRLLRADYGAVVLFPTADGPPVALVRRSDMPLDSAPQLSHLPEHLHQRVIDEGETVVISATSKARDERIVLDALGLRDCLAAPLLSGGSVIGAILVGDRLGHVSTFDTADARLFATLAFQAGAALDNGRLIEQLHVQARAREHDATHDALTGLPNRTLFAHQVEAVLRASTDTDALIAVLLMDLDHFKEVNDTLGHRTGDQLLQEVACRISAVIGDTGLAARLGGDEFAVLLPDLTNASMAIEMAERIHTRVIEPVRLASMSLEVGVSVGVAVCPDHGHDLTTLMQRADVAMYAAKRSREHISVYDPHTDSNSEVRLRLAGELRAALERRQILVHYQPIARISDGHIVKAEALVRWRHPELGLLPPDEFISVAERTGLIEELTLYVLDLALSQSRAWQAAGFDISVAVNLSVHVLLDVGWPAKVFHLLAMHGVAPDRLIFEITESGIMADPERMIPVLNKIAEGGVIFSIDDFGTGYSSLSYLQRLPVSEVKIDKSFVFPMTVDPAAANIVRSVVELGRSLGMRIVAEGAEDQRTLDHLAAINCDYVQGYYLSRPLPAVELTEWLASRLVPRI